MNSKNNNVGFRLPEDHLRELNRLAAQRGQSKGRLAKEIVTAALFDFGRFDELDHRLGVIEKDVHHLVEQSYQLKAIQAAISELKSSIATAVSRLLIDAAHVEVDQAISWTESAFNMEAKE